MTIRTPVPCNGCRLCCVNDLIVLHPECGDVVDDYETVFAINPLTQKPVYALAKKPGSNECLYLGPDGCTIHDRAPTICKEFDCRRLYQKWTRQERRRVVAKGLVTQAVLDAGRARMRTLK